jgi:hypothetical protein
LHARGSVAGPTLSSSQSGAYSPLPPVGPLARVDIMGILSLSRAQRQAALPAHSRLTLLARFHVRGHLRSAQARGTRMLLLPLQLLLVTFAGWISRAQQDVIVYQKTELAIWSGTSAS